MDQELRLKKSSKKFHGVKFQKSGRQIVKVPRSKFLKSGVQVSRIISKISKSKESGLNFRNFLRLKFEKSPVLYGKGLKFFM